VSQDYADYPPEDYPVTFQLGLAASDGWIIASDTLENRFAGAASFPNTRETRHTRKISYDPTAKIAYTSCGDEVTREVTEQIIKQYQAQFGTRPLDDIADYVTLKQLLEDTGERICKKMQAAKRPPQLRDAFFVFNHTLPFWTVSLRPQARVRTSCAESVTDKLFNGDSTTLAKWFIEQYYRETYSVRELLPMVAHSILTAGALNPSGVGGLEILCLEKDKVFYYGHKSPELARLKERSQEIDEAITGALLDLRG
jgi:hypothetical protein